MARSSLLFFCVLQRRQHSVTVEPLVIVRQQSYWHKEHECRKFYISLVCRKDIKSSLFLAQNEEKTKEKRLRFSEDTAKQKLSHRIAHPRCIASRMERRTAAGDWTKLLNSISAVTEADDRLVAPSALASDVPSLSLRSERGEGGKTATGRGRGRRGLCTAARAAFDRDATIASPAEPEISPFPEPSFRLPERRVEQDPPAPAPPPPAAASSAASCTASSTGLASNGTLRIRCRARVAAVRVLPTPVDKPPGGGVERAPLSHVVA